MRPWRIWCILVTLLALLSPGYCDTTANPNVIRRISDSISTARWRDDNSAFANARKVLLQETNGGHGAWRYVNKYEQEYKANQNDSLALYRFSFVAANSGIYTPDKADIAQCKRAIGALKAIRRPYNHELARNMFLLIAEVYQWTYSLRPLAEKLIKYDHNDELILRKMNYLYDINRDDANEAKALYYAREYKRVTKTPWAADLVIGEIYLFSWLARHQRKDIDGTVVAFEHFMATAPKGEIERQNMQRRLSELKEIAAKAH